MEILFNHELTRINTKGFMERIKDEIPVGAEASAVPRCRGINKARSAERDREVINQAVRNDKDKSPLTPLYERGGIRGAERKNESGGRK